MLLSPSEVVDSSCVEVPEAPTSVLDGGFGLVERLVIVLTTVVKNFVLSGSPDVSEMFIAVIVLTNVVTTSELD